MVISFVTIKRRGKRALARLAIHIRGCRTLRCHGHKKAGVIGFCFCMKMDAESSCETPRLF